MNHGNLVLLDNELRRDEGVRYERYQDSLGIWTIGVGHNLEASPLPGDWSEPLSDDQVNQLLNHDLQVVFAALDLHLPWWKALDAVRQRVLANMTFNMGIHSLLNFKHMLSAMRSENYDEASMQMLDSRWAQQVHERATRLSEMMRTGIA